MRVYATYAEKTGLVTSLLSAEQLILKKKKRNEAMKYSVIELFSCFLCLFQKGKIQGAD